MKKEKKSIHGYVPPDADINFSNNPLPPPETKYDKDIMIFDMDSVKKIVKGNYGKRDKEE